MVWPVLVVPIESCDLGKVSAVARIYLITLRRGQKSNVGNLSGVCGRDAPYNIVICEENCLDLRKMVWLLYSWIIEKNLMVGPYMN